MTCVAFQLSNCVRLRPSAHALQNLLDSRFELRDDFLSRNGLLGFPRFHISDNSRDVLRDRIANSQFFRADVRGRESGSFHAAFGENNVGLQSLALEVRDDNGYSKNISNDFSKRDSSPVQLRTTLSSKCDGNFESCLCKKKSRSGSSGFVASLFIGR